MLSRYYRYFIKLRDLLGVRAAIIFVIFYRINKFRASDKGKLFLIPVGKYKFYYPLDSEFAGRFMEIFIQEAYRLENTDKVIRVIDCGANIGMSLLYIKTKMPNARILCFEPNPSSRSVLEKNIGVNGWHDVEVLPYALGESEGKIEFFIEENVPTSSSASLARHEEERRNLRSIQVDVKKLSGYINESVDFLKMDIEGAEFSVFSDLIEHNKLKFIKNTQLEYHFHPRYFPAPVSQFVSLLENSQFEVYVEPLSPPQDFTLGSKAETYMVYAKNKNFIG